MTRSPFSSRHPKSGPGDRSGATESPSEPPDHEGDEKRPNRARPAPGASKPLTAARIRNIAEHYVGQRESSAQMLRAVLERRLMRRVRTLDPDAAAEERAAALPLIEAEIERLEKAGIISDARYAEMKARSALAAGRGSRRILRDLGQKGVQGVTAQEALIEAARETAGEFGDTADAGEVLGAAELEAAEAFARKRRLGPFRTEPLPEVWAERSKVWRREAGAMARAGFSMDTIRRVLDREPEED